MTVRKLRWVSSPSRVSRPPVAVGAKAPGMTAPLEQPGGSQVDGVEVVPGYRAQTLAADGLAFVFTIAAASSHGHGGDTARGSSRSPRRCSAPRHGPPRPRPRDPQPGQRRAPRRVAGRGEPRVGAALRPGTSPSGCSSDDDLCDTDGERLGGALLGLGLGMVSAVIIDSVVFAKGEVVHHAPRLCALAIAPTRAEACRSASAWIVLMRARAPGSPTGGQNWIGGDQARRGLRPAARAV